MGTFRGLLCSLFAVVFVFFSSLVQAGENPELIYGFPMDEDPGWQTEGLWEFGVPQGSGGDPSTGFTGENVYGYNLAGQYPNSMPQYWLTTSALDCSSYTNVVLQFERWLQIESSSFDHAYIHVSNDGEIWETIWTHSGSSLRTAAWQEMTYDISAVADGQATVYIRWGMGTTDSSATYCGWNIDDVEISGVSVYDVELSLSLPADVEEGDGAMPGAGQLLVSSAQSTNLVVVLNVDEGGELSLPEQLMIPAGQTNVYFDVIVLDDALLDGSTTTTVHAAASGYGPAEVSLPVHDNESATLTLSLPQTSYEGAGTISGTLQVNVAPDAAIVVELISNNPEKIGSSFVVIPAGQTFVSFTLPVIDNTEIDGVQTATIQAYVPNWISSLASVFVFDNETNGIELALPASLREGDGVVTNAGMISLAGTSPVDVQVLLSLSDSSEITAPVSVTVPAGQISASFDLAVVDDADLDGTQSISLLAEAPGFLPAYRLMDVVDDDIHHLEISLEEGEIAVLAPVLVGVSAKTIDGQAATLTAGPFIFEAYGDGGSLPVDPSEATNVSSSIVFGRVDNNVVLTVDDGMGHSGTSSVFNVTGAVLFLQPVALTNTLVVAGESVTRTMIISNAGNADLEFSIEGAIGAEEPNPDENLILYYTFDDDSGTTVVDQSGNGNDGTLMNNCTYTNGVYGSGLETHGNSSTFSSVGGHVLLPTLDYSAMNGLTVALWVKEEILHQSQGESYISFGTHPGYLDISRNSASSIRFVCGTEITTGVYAPMVNVFAHYALTYSNGKMRTYRNGEFLEEVDSELTVVRPDLAALGRHWWSSGSSSSTRLTAVFDEVRMYDRALSDSEISVLHSGDGGDGLIAHFPFDGNADDASGNEHDGIVSGAVLTMDRFENPDSAYDFNGSSAYISCGNIINGFSNFTVSAWVNIDRFTHSAYMGPWSQQASVYSLANGNYVFYTGTDSSSGFGTVMRWDDGVGMNSRVGHTLPINEWHLITQTYDGNEVHQYDNGELVNSTETGAHSLSNSFDFLIGKTAGYPGYLSTKYFDGQIDDLRIYNRALSASEIEELYGENDGDGLLVQGIRIVTNSNLVTNGNFEAGNFGFTSGYEYAPGAGSTERGSYTVGYDSQVWDSSLSSTMYDHTSSTGQMMMANGSMSAGTVVWQQDVEVVAGETYDLSAWTASLSDQYPPTLEFLINDVSVGSILTENLTWTEFATQWQATASGTVILHVVNTQVLPPFIGTGNRFAIDDIVFEPVTGAAPDAGLVASYPFNGSADDESGNGHDGTVNGAMLTADRFGNAGSAYLFDGIDDYIDLGNVEAFKTVSMWVKQDARSDYEFYFGHDDFRIFASVADNGKLTFSSGSGWIRGTPQMDNNVGTWNHIVAISDGTNSAIYFNGANVTSNGSGLISDGLSGNVNLGRWVEDTHYFHGALDDVSIYQRVLSEVEIQIIYSEGNSIPTDLETGLIASYPFNGNAVDESGNGHDGTVYDATLTTDRFGNEDSAYAFDGSGDYIHIGAEPNFPSWEDYTVSAWVLNDGGGDQNGNYGQKILDRTSFYHDFYLTVRSNGALYYHTYENSTARAIGDSNFDYRDNQWHHVAISKEGNVATMMIDGVNVGAISNATSVFSTSDLLIGYSESGDSLQRRYWSGKLDDIAIYDRALSVAELSALYNEDNSGSDPNSNSWLSVLPNSGTIAPGSNAVVDVMFDASGMMPGDTTNTMLTVVCNDVLSRSNEVPVSMWALPTAPTMLAEPATTDGVENEVFWNTVEGPVSYWVEMTSSTNGAPLADSGWVAVTNHMFQGLEASTAYFYRARASVDSSIGRLSGAWSDWVSSEQIPALVDGDGNGIPDWWEEDFFGQSGTDPMLDSDGDGQINRDEYIAGMDPTNGSSRFMVSEAGPMGGGNFVISWEAVTGRVYSVHWKNGMTNSFQSLETDIRSPQNSYTDTVHSAEDCGFYIIDVELDDSSTTNNAPVPEPYQ